jgi:hypothetical protein
MIKENFSFSDIKTMKKITKKKNNNNRNTFVDGKNFPFDVFIAMSNGIFKQIINKTRLNNVLHT